MVKTSYPMQDQETENGHGPIKGCRAIIIIFGVITTVCHVKKKRAILN
jgi:hypothetical protein